MADLFADSQQAQFDSAFAQAAVPAPKKAVDPLSPLPYYPAPHYMEHNLAPETSLSYDAVTALAKARRLAESKGVLTPDLGEHLLPMAMVEGHGGGFGIVHPTSDTDTSVGFYAKPETTARFKKMGLSIANESDLAQTGISANLLLRKDAKGDKFYVPGDNDNESGARLMAAVLADKAALKKSGGTVEGAVKLYNGRGRATEQADGQTVPADANTYWAKVQAAKAMLLHERNAPLMQHFYKTYLKGE